MKVSKIFEEIGWCKVVVNKIEEDYNQGKVSDDEVLLALKKLHNYLNIIENDIENMWPKREEVI